jgi:hypothetical protein
LSLFALKWTPEIRKKMEAVPSKGKSIHLIISNVLDSAASLQFSKIIKDITGESPKRTYDSTQHSSSYEFPFAGDKDDFMLKLMEGAKSINGIDALDILDEQEGLSRISIKAMIKME